MGFEPMVDSTGGLTKMIVRAWADDSGYSNAYPHPGTRSGDVHCVDGKEDGREVWKLAIT
jgi:hypothetical protein